MKRMVGAILQAGLALVLLVTPVLAQGPGAIRTQEITSGSDLTLYSSPGDTITLQTNNGTVLIPTGSITLGGIPLAIYPGAGIPVSTGSAWGASLTAPSGPIVGTTDTQTLSNKTLTSPVINTSATGSALQGTDSKLLTAGTISGTGSPLCTDVNGGATTSGCSGGGAVIVGQVDLTGQTTAIGNTTIYTPSIAGFYRISMWSGSHGGSWSAGTVTLNVIWTSIGVSDSDTPGSISYSYPTGYYNTKTIAVEVDGSVPIKYNVTFSGVSGTPNYDLHIRVESM